jgi:hypothetical protein
MNIRHHLLREAGKLASSQTVRRIELAAEIGRLEGRRSLSDAEGKRLEELRVTADNCGQALPRFGGYRPYQDPEPNCPYCWIVKGEASPLAANAGAESYSCRQCGSEYP